MKRIIYSLMTAVVAFYAGCDAKKEPARRAPSNETQTQSSVPTVAQYRVLLEKRMGSVDGADINIMQEVRKYENASDDEKRELYKNVKALVK